MIEIVNMVGSGALGRELNLESVYESIGHPVAKYDPEMYPAIYLRFGDDYPLITIYRSGKYIITGATSKEEMSSVRERFLAFSSDLGITEEANDVNFSIKNYVCTEELGHDLNLNNVSIALGLEQTEYEPEQFPGIIYRPEAHHGVVLIFSTGNIIITGCRSFEAAEEIFTDLENRLLSSI